MMIHKGIVQKGQRSGTALGYPTANIPLPSGVPAGIYAARVYVGEDGTSHMGAVFIDTKRAILETHILDFSNDLYGQSITVELLKKIRDARDFSDEKTLRDAIADDIENVRAYLSRSV